MSLTLAEARARVATISDVSYTVDLDLTSPRDDTFGCRTTVRFTTTVAKTFLELTGASGLSVTLDGHEVVPTYDGRRLWLTGLGGTHEVVATARLPYVTDGDGMHRMVDPADGEVYVGAYLGMDIAQKVLCCFDQNDLKAPITLTARADPAWTVLANGRTVASADGRWEFAPTPPIPLARCRARPRRGGAARRHRGLLPALRVDLRGALPLRLLRPGLRPGAQLGRPGDAGLRDLPRRAAWEDWRDDLR